MRIKLFELIRKLRHHTFSSAAVSRRIATVVSKVESRNKRAGFLDAAIEVSWNKVAIT